jgi:hypothetical protein
VWVYIYIYAHVRYRKNTDAGQDHGTTRPTPSAITSTQYDASLQGKPDCCRLTIMFKLGNNGDVFVQYSKPVTRPDTGNIVYPIVWYLIRYNWFVKARNGTENGKGQPWSNAQSLTKLQRPTRPSKILHPLQARLFNSEHFQSIWEQDTFDTVLGHPLDGSTGHRFQPRVWCAEGPQKEYWEGDEQEQWWMQKNLDMLNTLNVFTAPR